jgi:putative spermidine/putrescine transport system permease protein
MSRVRLFLANPKRDVLPIRMWSMLESTLDVRTAAVSGVLIATTASSCSSWTGWRA